jgi:ABC-2 type transport system permease protein
VSTTGAAPTARGSRPNDLQMVRHQVAYEQRTFWRNRFGATFTVGFSTVFLLLLALAGGTSRFSVIGNIRGIQYYVPAFIAYGVMSACFSVLAITLVNRREVGLLKRLRLSPLPARAMMAALFVSALVVCCAQVVILLAIGRLAFQLRVPDNYLALVVALVAGAACFTALGVAASTVVPNQDAAGPLINVVFFALLFLSGMWYPLRAGSGLAQASSYFPVRSLITATFAPFDLRPGTSPWAWHDIFVMAIWGVAAAIVAVRRFRWEPRRG